VHHTEDSSGDGGRLDGCVRVLIRWCGPADCEDRYRAVHDRLRRTRNQAVCQKHLLQFTSEKTLLFVHGATQPAEATFDLPLEGSSWMDYIAQHGWDVYLVDARGYGRSTRPPEMDQPAASNPPIVTTDVAVKDVGSAIDFILQRRGIPRINLMGWSWGTVTMGAYTADHNDKVERLVL